MRPVRFRPRVSMWLSVALVCGLSGGLATWFGATWFGATPACAAEPALASLNAEKPLQVVVFGSCADQDQPQPIWNAMLAQQPNLVLLLGDNIYADTSDPVAMREKYAILGAQLGFQKMRATCPLLAIWDDHDYGLNDGGADFPFKATSQKLFLEFFREPATSARWKRPGLYDAKIMGPIGQRVQVILLDTRYFRSPLKKGPQGNIGNLDRDATILGADQWKWLAEQFLQPAEVRLVISSIQVVAADHPFEKWANFPAEQKKLFDLIKSTRANGVIFLSGDRHLAELSVVDDRVGYPLYDLTSSGLNRGGRGYLPLELNSHRLGTMSSGDNFGEVLIEWEPPAGYVAPERSPAPASPHPAVRKGVPQWPRIRLQIRDVAGDLMQQTKIPLSRLRSGYDPAAE